MAGKKGMRHRPGIERSPAQRIADLKKLFKVNEHAHQTRVVEALGTLIGLQAKAGQAEAEREAKGEGVLMDGDTIIETLAFPDTTTYEGHAGRTNMGEPSFSETSAVDGSGEKAPRPKTFKAKTDDGWEYRPPRGDRNLTNSEFGKKFGPIIGPPPEVPSRKSEPTRWEKAKAIFWSKQVLPKHAEISTRVFRVIARWVETFTPHVVITTPPFKEIFDRQQGVWLIEYGLHAKWGWRARFDEEVRAAGWCGENKKQKPDRLWNLARTSAIRGVMLFQVLDPIKQVNPTPESVSAANVMADLILDAKLKKQMTTHRTLVRRAAGWDE